MVRDRDWNAVAERLQRDVRGGAALVPVADLAGLAGARPGALVRWVVRGKRGVHLDAVRGAGKTWRSTEPAVWRFLAELSARDAPAPAAAPSPTRLERQAAAARAELERLRRGGSATLGPLPRGT